MDQAKRTHTKCGFIPPFTKGGLRGVKKSIYTESPLESFGLTLSPLHSHHPLSSPRRRGSRPVTSQRCQIYYSVSVPHTTNTKKVYIRISVGVLRTNPLSLALPTHTCHSRVGGDPDQSPLNVAKHIIRSQYLTRPTQKKVYIRI